MTPGAVSNRQREDQRRENRITAVLAVMFVSTLAAMWLGYIGG